MTMVFLQSLLSTFFFIKKKNIFRIIIVGITFKLFVVVVVVHK